jgi:hypothetical protein
LPPLQRALDAVRAELSRERDDGTFFTHADKAEPAN